MTLEDLGKNQGSMGAPTGMRPPTLPLPRCPRTAIVASDDVGRHKLEAILASVAIPIVGCARNVRALLGVCKGESLDVAVLWCGQSSSGWQPEVRLLAGEMPVVKIVVTAAIDEGRGVRRALRAGANGFVPKCDVDSCLLATINAALAGQLCVPCGAREQIARPALSHREKRILELLALGYTNNEIAGRLYLAESTVKTHVSACFRKLGVHTRAEAAAVVLDPQSAVELGVVPTPIGDRETATAGATEDAGPSRR